MKISENYALREDVLNAFNHMTRNPRVMTLDIKARMGALRIVERRLHSVIEKVGPEQMIGALRYNIKVAAEAVKKRIKEWNDGKFRHAVFLDCVGQYSRMMKIAATLEKKGDSIYLDFDGTSPEVTDRVANSVSLGVMGLQMVYWMGHLFPDLPHNSGILEGINFRFPEGSMLSPGRESPKAGAPFVQEAAAQMVHQLLQKAVFSTNPELGEATGGRTFSTIIYGGVNQYGAPIADSSADTNASGFGARFDKDGVNVAGSYFAPGTSEPGEVESLEANYPFLYLYRGNQRDDCGMGKFRGGVGIEWAVAVQDVPMVFLGSWGYASKAIVTQGVFGGYGNPALPFVRLSGTNVREMLEQGDTGIPTSNRMLFEDKAIEGIYESDKFPSPPRPTGVWDVVIGGHAGGGGYGDPIERDPLLVMRDLENGIVSHRVARDLYKIVYDQEKLIVDEEATDEMREKVRVERKARGQKYSEFEIEWLKRKPNEEILEFYGEWPTTKYKSFIHYGNWPDTSQR